MGQNIPSAAADMAEQREIQPTMTREELYALVWSEPMVKVAARFGVSHDAISLTRDVHRVS